MNKERLTELADYIEKLPHFTKNEIVQKPIMELNIDYFDQIKGFNMARWFSDRECGTAGCIAGHTISLFASEEEKERVLNSPIFLPSAIARNLLDIDSFDALTLFQPNTLSWNQITPKEAAQAIRKLRDGVDPEEIWNVD